MFLCAADAGDVGAGGLQGVLGEVCLGFCEGGDEPWVGAEEVGDDGDFAIAGGFSAADADGRDGDGGGDFFCGAGGEGFEDDGEYTGFDESGGSGEDFAGLLGRFAFFPISAFFEDALGQHAEVAADGDACGGDGADFFRLADAAFELYGIGSGGEKGAGGFEGLFRGRVGIDGKICDDESFWLRADDGLQVVEDVGKCDVGGVWKAEDDHAE